MTAGALQHERSDDVIDLRSDTVTRPSPSMRQAIAEAEVGDEQKGEDPTVHALEERVAALLGQEAAVFVPSATMANQIALAVLGRRGDELLADPLAHVFLYELGGPSAISGLVMKPIEGSKGTFSADLLLAAITAPAWYRSSTSVVAVENTHSESGGTVWPAGQLREVVELTRSHGLGAHLDGARLMNASIASGHTPQAIAGQFDTVTVCLSKGLGCPVGAVLATSAGRAPAARRMKQMLGGAMRQAGLLAAAGLHALDHNIERLEDDHRAAAALAKGLADSEVPLVDRRPQTNMVLIDLTSLSDHQFRDAARRIAQAGVLLSTVHRPRVLRAVTHLDASAEQVVEAGHRIASAVRPLLSPTTQEPQL